ncbi:hypothetical protein SDJN02_08216, partial [Cucurbita argyrosperma subsp. argyrosperma]
MELSTKMFNLSRRIAIQLLESSEAELNEPVEGHPSHAYKAGARMGHSFGLRSDFESGYGRRMSRIMKVGVSYERNGGTEKIRGRKPEESLMPPLFTSNAQKNPGEVVLIVPLGRFSSKETRFKNIEGKPKRESPNRIISVSGEPGLLQMVSELDTGRCASEESVPQRGIDTKQCGVHLVGVPHRLEKGTSAHEDAGL